MKKISLFTIALLTSFAGHTQTLQPWMSPEVLDAWNAKENAGLGYKGQGVTITVVDDFRSTSVFSGNFTGQTETKRHGEWTRQEAQLIAPSASFVNKDFTTNTRVGLSTGLNVLNLSYGMYAKSGIKVISWGSQESSIIEYAKNGTAVISKAAGNDGVAIGSNTSKGIDYLNVYLKGAQSAIFVGALSKNGSVIAPAAIATYSNKAGSDKTIQNQFLVVGVEGAKTGLYGTSFAAPIVSGYAAILGSKFTDATPTQIVNQLLNTARKDTVINYSANVYGRGEASITRALAPVTVPK